jgi:beta-galactosidase/beta-glucuronidase
MENPPPVCPRPEYPRPQWRRAEWVNLNGLWEFETDPGDVGLRSHWWERPSFAGRIVVPFPPESRLSGLADTAYHDVVWYRRTVTIDPADGNRRWILHFGAVDYAADVWVNGMHVGRHEGGHTPFAFDLSPWVPLRETPTSLRIVVRAEDAARDLSQPRGKQSWEPRSAGIFYTRTTGIWQTVWMEPVPETYLDRAWCTPNLDDGSITWNVILGGSPPGPGCRLHIAVEDGDGLYGEIGASITEARWAGRLTVDRRRAEHLKPWTPETPHLYTVTYRLYQNGRLVDTVVGYLGFRRIEARDGRLWLNGRPLFLKMVLDQGYFPGGVLTAGSEEALRQDVEWVKRLGFNGVRKHQKVEDPVWLTWCDRIGVLVFGEMANGYAFTPEAVGRLTREWMAVLERDYNHPSIVAWVPVNESWGVPAVAQDAAQQHFLAGLYHLTKALDPNRLVVSNDGWEHVVSDLLTVHDYDGDAESLHRRYANRAEALQAQPAGRVLLVPPATDGGQPVVVSEMGGTSVQADAGAGWGYSTVASGTDLAARYTAQVRALALCPPVQGYCYTQLTDVEQETNGLLTADRVPKVDPAAICAANDQVRRWRSDAAAD